MEFEEQSLEKMLRELIDLKISPSAITSESRERV